MKSLLKLLCACLALSAPLASAQNFPVRPIEVVVGYGAGGGSDLSIRMVEAAAAKRLGQKIVVTNKPGAGGVIAFNQFIRAQPDGYTMAIGTTAMLTVQPHIDSQAVLYKPDDYLPVVQISFIPNVLIVPADSPIKTYAQLIETAKKSPPGKLKVGVTSIGAMTHLPFVQVEKLQGIKFTFIPHKSSAAIVTSVMGGHLDAAGADLPAVAAQIRAGSVRAIGLFAGNRLASLPAIPTLKEQGTDVEAGFYNMLFVPKGTPPQVLGTLRSAFKEALHDPEVIERANKADLPIEYLDGEACRKRLQRDYEIHGALIRELGLAR
jgi:tripartite-type tricarboxylate transporter receptor subunit TctC